MLGSGGPGGRGGGVVGHGGKGPLLLLRVRNSDAAPGSVGPGMLTERSQCQGQTPAEAGVLSTGAEPWNSSGSVGETGELGSEVRGCGDCGERGFHGPDAQLGKWRGYSWTRCPLQSTD